MSELFSAMRGFAHGRSKALGILPDVGGLKAEAFDAFLYACQLARSSRLLYQKVYDPWDWWRTLTRMKTAAHAKAAFLVEVMEVEYVFRGGICMGNMLLLVFFTPKFSSKSLPETMLA